MPVAHRVMVRRHTESTLAWNDVRTEEEKIRIAKQANAAKVKIKACPDGNFTFITSFLARLPARL